MNTTKNKLKVNVIIPCGGKSSRTGLSKNKILYPIDDVPVIARTITPFASIKEVTRIILPVGAPDMEKVNEILLGIKTLGYADVIITKGGDTRTGSVKNGLELVENDCDIVVIHDGARPFVKTDIIEKCIESAVKYGSGICCTRPTDTIAVAADDRNIMSIPDRNKILLVQTPQAFTTDNIQRAYSLIKEGEEFTDDSSVYLEYIGKPSYVIGESNNTKITYREDLEEFKNLRIGYGFDTHKLVEGRKLILGNVEIPHDKGLLGHSDADVLIHAIMDALLSASGNRDIGVQFPDSDAEYKDIDSIVLLRKVRDMIKAEKLAITSISAVIIAEKPKLMSFIPQMEARITRCLGINKKQFSITCTTMEGLGLVGREEGISARAVAILGNKNKLA